MDAQEPQFRPLEERYSDSDPRSAYVTRFARRVVKLTALTDTELMVVSVINAAVSIFLSFAFFWFGLFAARLKASDSLSNATKFDPPYLFLWIGLFGVFVAVVSYLFGNSLLKQIRKETTPFEPAVPAAQPRVDQSHP
jgi:hypothetical protein